MTGIISNRQITKPHRVLLITMLFFLSGMFWAGQVKAACSVYAGDATFNEYYFGTDTNFLEVYIKNINTIPQADWQNWTLRVYKSATGFTDYVLNDTTSTYCPFGSKAYVTFDVPELPDPDFSVVLLDASGNEIDYLDACGPPESCSQPGYYTPDAAVCSSNDHDLNISSLGNKDIARFPDGSGDWSISGGTGAGTSFTSCSANNAGITKIASAPTVAIGSTITFTIDAINSDNKSAAFVIEDDIPTGFTYESATATKGTVSVAGTVVTWDIDSLDGKGGVASLAITVTGSVEGSYDNTAIVTTPCADASDCPRDMASVDVTVAAAPSVDHFAIVHDGTGVTCQAELVTVSAHKANDDVEDGYAGTLNLSTSTGNGDWSVFAGSGTLTPGAADSGSASYAFSSTDNGQVQLLLKYTHVETVNIDVIDISSGATETDDPDLVFAETGFRFIDAADVPIPIIGTQIAGKGSATAPNAQTLYLQAIRSSDDGLSCSGVFADGTTANIDLGSSCNNPVSCLAGQRVSVTNNGTTTAIANPQNQDAGLNYSSVPLTFTTNSGAPIVLNYSDAGKIQLNASYNIPLGTGAASGNLMTGNSNAFVVRPFGFELDFSNDRAINGVTGASYAADASSSKFQIAGADFPVSLAAVVWNSADDLDNNGIPDTCADLSDNAITSNFGNETTAVIPANVALSNKLVAPAEGIAGAVSTSANGASFASGVGSKTISWNEVGIMNLQTTLSSYLVAGQNVTGNVCNVGRFYPDHFVITNPVITNRSDIMACVDPFTYMGENFTISYDLQARSINPPGSITQNYINSFALLDPASLANMNYGATDSGTDLTARLGVASAGVFAAGVAPVSATLLLTRNAVPDGPYSNFNVGILPTDSDSVSLLAADLNLSLNGGANTHGLLGQTDIRYGRLNLQNNFGSELLTLTMPMSTEYYLNATAEFITNVDDSCTTRTFTDILLYNDQEAKTGRVPGDPVINVNGASSTTLTGIDPFVAGRSSLTFSAPGAEGYVDVEVQAPNWLQSDLDSVDQGVQGPGLHCNPSLVVSDPAYIVGCVADDNIVDETPLRRGNFGIFKGSDNIIYIRETY